MLTVRDVPQFHGRRAFYVTMAVHGAIAVVLISIKPTPRPPGTIVAVAVHRARATPPSARLPPASPPVAIRQHLRRLPQPRAGTLGPGKGLATPNQTPAPDTNKPPPPSLGLSPASFTPTPDGPAFAAGNTTIGTTSGLSTAPLPAGGGGTGGSGPAGGPGRDLTAPPSIIGRTCDIPESEYPPMAQRFGISGATELRIDLDEQGSVLKVAVEKSAFHALDETAVYYARSRCKYRPARDRDGKPTLGILYHTVNWQVRPQLK